jgi:hypothetical protein
MRGFIIRKKGNRKTKHLKHDAKHASSSPINHEDNTNEDHPMIGILSVYLERELEPQIIMVQVKV